MAAERGTRRLVLRGAFAAALLCRATAAGAEPDRVEVRTDALRAVFSLDDARIVSLEVLQSDGPGMPWGALSFGGDGAPPPVSVAFAARSARTPRAAPAYAVERSERADAVVLRFRLPSAAAEAAPELTYEISRSAPVLGLAVAMPAEDAAALPETERGAPELVLAAGSTLEVQPAAGLGGLSERVRGVLVDAGEATEVAPPFEAALEPGRWVGVRNRYWALLATSEAPALAELRSDGVALRSEPGTSPRWRAYVGPVEHHALISVDPSLAALIFAERWRPLRALAFGLLFLFETLLRWVGHVGAAIVLLSFAVKALLHPLTLLAERWQREVNETRARLEPRMAEIRARHRGEERSRRVLQLHREQGVTLFYGLKSLLGLAIQVPMFFAAYHMLDESVALSGASFLWIRDLARPDQVATLPFSLWFLGKGVNALPFAMTAATLVSSRLHDDGSLPPALLRRQRRGLYAMAGGFLLLFYTFPAGMVLYWTTNNLISCARYALRHVVPQRRGYRGVETHGTST